MLTCCSDSGSTEAGLSLRLYAGELDTSQGLNRYAYVMGNPLRYTDPTGHASWDDVLNTTDPQSRAQGFSRPTGYEGGADYDANVATKTGAARFFAEVSYRAGNAVTFGHMARVDQLAGKLNRQEISLKEFESGWDKSSEIAWTSAAWVAAEVVVTLATGGFSLPAQLAIGAAFAVGSMAHIESKMVEAGFQQDLSSPGTYAAAGVMGGLFQVGAGTGIAKSSLRESAATAISTVRRVGRAAADQVVESAGSLGGKLSRLGKSFEGKVSEFFERGGLRPKGANTAVHAVADHADGGVTARGFGKGGFSLNPVEWLRARTIAARARANGIEVVRTFGKNYTHVGPEGVQVELSYFASRTAAIEEFVHARTAQRALARGESWANLGKTRSILEDELRTKTRLIGAGKYGSLGSNPLPVSISGLERTRYDYAIELDVLKASMPE